MSPPPHREKDAKVEGRDPPETAPNETMGAFRTLTRRLLGVSVSEIEDQQRLYDAAKYVRQTLRLKKLKISPALKKIDETKGQKDQQITNTNK